MKVSLFGNVFWRIVPERWIFSRFFGMVFVWSIFSPDLRGIFRGSSTIRRPLRPFILRMLLFAQFAGFIGDTIVQWVASGVLSVWREVGVVSLPHLVLPITIEPSKPPLRHDERFLNLWIRDLPFKLDHLADLPRYVLPGHFQTTFDDKLPACSAASVI